MEASEPHTGATAAGQTFFLHTQEAWPGSSTLGSHTAPKPHNIPLHTEFRPEEGYSEAGWPEVTARSTHPRVLESQSACAQISWEDPYLIIRMANLTPNT